MASYLPPFKTLFDQAEQLVYRYPTSFCFMALPDVARPKIFRKAAQ
ncbi:hypothetical protein H8B06_12020 [Sphingobacterium sp. DN00404]|uniref:Uncharacterized protein n=1 Tax=Sphingobacterium micropteri TaxID=2763501 RepID=A0ABR7YQV0_9SPHI|nr:hypothetical protein [Sphingobacterium micropteri]MBD1433558.1 hypothetical protein [Sphingobacterium micropteri]